MKKKTWRLLAFLIIGIGLSLPIGSFLVSAMLSLDVGSLVVFDWMFLLCLAGVFTAFFGASILVFFGEKTHGT